MCRLKSTVAVTTLFFALSTLLYAGEEHNPMETDGGKPLILQPVTNAFAVLGNPSPIQGIVTDVQVEDFLVQSRSHYHISVVLDNYRLFEQIVPLPSAKKEMILFDQNGLALRLRYNLAVTAICNAANFEELLKQHLGWYA